MSPGREAVITGSVPGRYRVSTGSVSVTVHPLCSSIITCDQASCLLIAFRWTCVCDDGYLGNGRLCYGTIWQVRRGRLDHTDPHVEVSKSTWCFQELMVLQEASEFFTWTSVSTTSEDPRRGPGPKSHHHVAL